MSGGPTARPGPLFPPGVVSEADVLDGVEDDVARAAEEAERISRSGRLGPRDLDVYVGPMR